MLEAGRSGASQLRKRLQKRGILVMPGAFNAIIAMQIEQLGFEGVYITGAGLIDGIAGFPDIGLFTMTEVVEHAKYIADAIIIPAICDADTGYGEAINVMRTVREFERAGIAGIHIGDQQLPKRCGHLPDKKIVSTEAMVQKIFAAVKARKDSDFLIIARCDARGVTGLEDAINRSQAYLEAGADMIFPEALQTDEEFKIFAKEVKGALLANMTEFGKSPYISAKKFEDMGYKVVIFPMTTFRIMMKAVRDALRELKTKGTQEDFLDQMQTRNELYELIRYKDYEQLDEEIANYKPLKRG